jgi:hypothetical protein
MQQPQCNRTPTGQPVSSHAPRGSLLGMARAQPPSNPFTQNCMYPCYLNLLLARHAHTRSYVRLAVGWHRELALPAMRSPVRSPAILQRVVPIPAPDNALIIAPHSAPLQNSFLPHNFPSLRCAMDIRSFCLISLSNTMQGLRPPASRPQGQACICTYACTALVVLLSLCKRSECLIALRRTDFKSRRVARCEQHRCEQQPAPVC